MSWLVNEIARNERRIKKITEDPDPTKFKCNRILYELEKDLRKAQLEAWENGKVCIASGLMLIEPLLKALGFQTLAYYAAADRLMVADEYIGVAKSEGFPEMACDRNIAYLGMCVKKDLPPPGFVVATNAACDPLFLSATALAHRFNVPLFCVDVPLEESEDALQYVARQLRELIDFAQARIPGIKYDQDKMVELQKMDRLALESLRDIYQLRKRVPCPIPVQDTFRIPQLPSVYPDPARAVEYFRSFRDELVERAERSTPGEEKLRVMWTCSAPFFADPFKVLSERGASIPIFQIDITSRFMAGKGGLYGDEEYGRKLLPLEEQARMLFSCTWVGPGKRWIDDVLYICQDLSIDAIVNFMLVGCLATVGLGKLLADEAKRRLGIPTLLIEGRQLSAGYYDRAAFEDTLANFIDLCLQRKPRAAL